jgi:hypothetical protein
MVGVGVANEGILPSNSPYRIFMQHHKMQGLG